MVSLQVQTEHFGIGVNPKQVGTYFGKKTAEKLNHIENNPFAVIVTFLMIHQELIPSMIDAVSITPGGLFKMLCMGMVVAEFNDVIFKSSRKTFNFIQVDINKKICIVDEKSDEVKAWK